LKQNNDVFGHSAGSALLVDTARLLQSIFRETDVIGRVGGDEFAVAGQFSRDAIEKAAERLETHAATLRENSRLPVRLSLSVGYVTSDPEKHEKLADLLEQADSAMYEQKRRKKLLAV
jgi:diguanylate cyclase (GGDEF)-like protein